MDDEDKRDSTSQDPPPQTKTPEPKPQSRNPDPPADPFPVDPRLFVDRDRGGPDPSSPDDDDA